MSHALQMLRKSWIRQNTSAVKAEPPKEQRAVYTKRSPHIRWRADDYRKLKDAHEKCMSTRDIAALFPTRTYLGT